MKNFLILLFLPVLFWSCKGKSNIDPELNTGGDPQFYVYADIDGVPFKNIGTDDVIADNSDYSDMFQLSVYPQEYQELRFGTQHALKGKPGDFKLYYAYYQKSRYNVYEPRDNEPINGKCTITKISDNIVEGTFAFDVYSDGGQGNVKIKVTNGRFRAEY